MLYSGAASTEPFFFQWMFSPTVQEEGGPPLRQDYSHAGIARGDAEDYQLLQCLLYGAANHPQAGSGGRGSLQIHISISPQLIAVGTIIHDNSWPLVSHGAQFAHQYKGVPQ